MHWFRAVLAKKWARMLISLLLLLGIGYQLYAWDPALRWPRAEPLWALCALLLLPLNLGAEARKLQQAYRTMGIFTGFGSAVRAVLGSATAAFLTPNRLGEIPARLAWLPASARARGLHALALERLSQLSATLFAAAPALLWASPFSSPTLSGGLALGCILLGLGILWPFVGRLPIRLPGRWQAWYPVRISHWALLGVLAWAGLRYAIFSLQYLLLLWAFGVSLPTGLLLAGISLTYAAKSVVPSIALAELGIREAAALSVFGVLGAPAAPILAATLLLFTLNLVLPALLGCGPSLRWIWARAS
ncbi:MAG: flippase-like domain-containing protein [Bacteroidetes bacterium]|jgi:hypothetical protein|nr:flippase-like domain-containing protein [Bacteroidota bacterium]